MGSLYSHNYLRALHGAPSLHWNDNLAYKASSWAYHLAILNQGMSHSSMQGYGENVYSQTGASSYIHSYKAVHRWLVLPYVKLFVFRLSVYRFTAVLFSTITVYIKEQIVHIQFFSQPDIG